MSFQSGEAVLSAAHAWGRAFGPPAPSQLPVAAHIHRHAAALFDPLHLPVPEGRLQVRAVELDRELRDAVRPAEGAGLEGLLGLVVTLPSGA